jgi:[ribosomal protein S18]-alanine N-acetyltransferase
MRSNIAGRGLGAEVVVAGLRFAKDAYSPPTFRLTVAAFNLRAVRMYERVGFDGGGVRRSHAGRRPGVAPDAA